MNYDNMPFHGKISPGAWEAEHYGRNCYGELARRNKRKLCRHKDPYINWWKSRTLGENWSYQGAHVSKGRKPKTWKDYK